MAIYQDDTQLGLDGKPMLTLKFENGDREALSKIVSEWGFKDEASAIKFMMAVLIRTENKRLWVENAGSPVRIEPTNHLLISPENDSETA